MKDIVLKLDVGTSPNTRTEESRGTRAHPPRASCYAESGPPERLATTLTTKVLHPCALPFLPWWPHSILFMQSFRSLVLVIRWVAKMLPNLHCPMFSQHDTGVTWFVLNKIESVIIVVECSSADISSDVKLVLFEPSCPAGSGKK